MRLYNTLTRKVEKIKPIANPVVSVYTCGPTVYDYPHIGNWFTFLRYDILIRALRSSGLKPKWVMNITDVGHLVSDQDEGEDKLEKGARREGKTAWEVAEFYTDNFLKGLQKLNVSEPDNIPKATQHIDEQIDLVNKLEARGFTYSISDGVYFDTSKLKDYGKLAKLDIKNLKEGARVEANPEKRNPTDFALWKLTPSGQKRDMEWDSPWGRGFPGWHLECSAMSMKYLGETIDIHGGGIDHIPVHHTNEIAQSEAGTGKPFAHYWMHANFITVNAQKISKSLGNGITLEDIQAKGFDLLAVRVLVLESHYRTQSVFSWDTLEAAQNRLNSLRAMADLKWQAIKSESWLDFDNSVIETSLQSDLNTPQALAYLSECTDVISNKLLSIKDKIAFENFLIKTDALLGLELAKREDIDSLAKQLIAERETARQAKDWTKSDSLRDQLAKKGIIVRDTDAGPIWSRS